MMHHIYVKSGLMQDTVAVLCLQVLNGNILSVAMLFYSKTELLHNISETLGWEWVWWGQKKGFHFGFYFV